MPISAAPALRQAPAPKLASVPAPVPASMPAPARDTILNVSGYLFTPLTHLSELAHALRQRAVDAALRGTVLLADEGINVFLAGPAPSVHAWLSAARRWPGLAELKVKNSWSATQPFKRLKVKIKPEIIRMNQPAVVPGPQCRAPAVQPHDLKRWLDQGHDDEGRPVRLLDTRNAFEVDVGAFVGAVDWRLQRFTQFPDAYQRHAGDLAGATVVSYCTGGIRCEKAALWMQSHADLAGPARVLQLEGGILGYFEAIGAAHFQGECFVFDERTALDGALQAHTAAPNAPAADLADRAPP
jgi:UPF0176 protein